MANDARTQFVDGLRVTADHLQHLQDRLRDAMRDIRYSIGFRKIAWGLHVTAPDGSVNVTPGVAFAPSGVRLNIDTAANVPIPTGSGPWRVTLKAVEQDRASLRVGNKPTLISLITAASIEPAGGPDPGADALVIATLQPGEAGFTVVQDPDIFAVAGHHAHSGEFRQDADGRWYYDGPNVEGEQGPKGDKGDKGDPGEKGATGAKGTKGDRGDPGDAGPPGAPGAKGDKGDPGAAGSSGAPGAPGAKGDKGDPGAPGAPGTPGAKGDKGDPGAPGTAGSPGAPGAKGDKGDPGVQGPQGPPGTGLDPDPTMLSKISWPLGQTVPMPTAQNLLTRVRIDLTAPLDPASVADQTQVVQVWFLSNTVSQTGTGTPIQFLHGTTQLAGQTLQWTATETALQIRNMIINGGQVLLRVHCGYLFDTRQRPLSAALNAVALMPNKAPVYGGVFEAWFFVAAG